MLLSSQLLNIEGTGKLRKELSLSKCLGLFRRVGFGFYTHTHTHTHTHTQSWLKKMHNLKVENYIVFRGLVDSFSDCSEGLFQRGKEGARL